MNYGWVSIHRQLQNHWLWNDKPFSHGQAWIDMILLANHSENKFPLGNEIITVETGSFITSELKLMDRWGWSKAKVRRFLSLLENDLMIVKKTDRKKTTITIVNYSDFQFSEPQTDQKKTNKEPIKDQKKTDKRPKKDTNNNDNNSNNENNEKQYGQYHNVKLTIKQYDKLVNDFGDYIANKAITYLDEYIEEKGYKSKSHNLAIRRWVVDAVKEKESKKGRKEIVPDWMKNKPGFNEFEQRKMDAEIDEMEQLLMKEVNSAKTVNNDPELAERAAKLQEKLKGV